MVPPKTSPPQIPQNLLCFQQNLSCWSSLDTSGSPGDPSAGQSKRIMYPWISDTSDIPVAETAHGRKAFIRSSEARFQHCLMYWTLVKNGNGAGSLWQQEWAGGKDFFWLRRWFCTRGSKRESSARDSVESPRGKGKSGCRPWPREQLLLEMDLSGLGWREVFWNESPGICSPVFSLPLYLLLGWLFGLVDFFWAGVFDFGGLGFVAFSFVVFCLSINLFKAENSSEYPVKHHAVLWMVWQNSILNCHHLTCYLRERDVFFE